MKLLFIFLISAMTLSAQTPEWSRKYHTGSVTCLDFSSDGGKLLSGSYDQTIRLWDLSKGDTIRTFKSIKARIDNVDFNITGKTFLVSYLQGNGEKAFKTSIFSIDQDSIIKIFENRLTMEVIHPTGGMTSDYGDPHHNYSYFFHNDSSIVNMASGQFRIGPGASNEGWISSENLYKSNQQLLFNKLGRFTVRCVSKDKMKTFGGGDWDWVQKSGGSGGTVYTGGGTDYQYIDFETGVKTPVSYKPRNVRAVTFSSDEKSILIALSNGSIYIGKTPQCLIIDSLGSQRSLATALAADMQGRYYFSAHEDSKLHIWTPGVYNVSKRVKLQSPVTTIAISPDSVHFATAHTDGTVSYWNIDSLAYYALNDSGYVLTIDSISQNKLLCKGEDAEFSVSAKVNFDKNLSYQWQKDGTNLVESDSVSGTSSPKLIVKGIDKSDVGKYTVKVALSGIDTATATVQLFVVVQPPVITTHPQAEVKLIMNATVTISVELLDTTAATYEWFKDGNKLEWTTPDLWFHNVGSYAVGTYKVRVTNPCGSVMSNESVLHFPVSSISENPFKTTKLSAEPNPFKNSTTIHFSLPKPLKIKLVVTDILGREIAVLKDEVVEISEQNVVFKNENLPDGMYFITLSGEGFLKTIPVQTVR